MAIPTQVIPCQIDQHHMLGIFFGINNICAGPQNGNGRSLSVLGMQGALMRRSVNSPSHSGNDGDLVVGQVIGNLGSQFSAADGSVSCADNGNGKRIFQTGNISPDIQNRRRVFQPLRILRIFLIAVQKELQTGLAGFGQFFLGFRFGKRYHIMAFFQLPEGFFRCLIGFKQFIKSHGADFGRIYQPQTINDIPVFVHALP